MQNNRKKAAAVLVLAALCAGLFLAGKGTALTEAKTQETDTGETEYLAGTEKNGENGSAVKDEDKAARALGIGTEDDGEQEQKDKTETVYVQTDATGTAEEITVETVLKRESGTADILDRSSLTDIRNTKGEEEYTREANQGLRWQNLGEEISYEGKSTKTLPVSMKITYYLDGKEISPEKLAGQSGRVRIRFDYENHTQETVEIDGEKVTVQVPFAVVTVLFLPTDTFSDLAVTNGKTAAMDSQNVVLGMALPGVSDSLQLADYELTEELEIPDYVEVTADVTDFELDFTATIMSTGVFGELKDEDLDDFGEISDAFGELSDASGDILDGAVELLDGTETFQEYLGEYLDGASKICEGIGELTDGLGLLNTNKTALLTGAQTMQDSLKSMDTMLEQLTGTGGTGTAEAENAGGAGTSGSAGENGTGNAGSFGSVPDSAAAAAAMEALAKDARGLETMLETLEGTLAQLQSLKQEAKSYQTTIQQVVGQVQTELDGVEFSGVDAEATRQAKEQAAAAISGALDNLSGTEGLTEELKSRILSEASGKIQNDMQIDGLTDAAAEKLTAAKQALSSIPAWDVPETDIDTGGVQALIDDMQAQLVIVNAYAEQLTGLMQNMSSMNTILADVKGAIGQLCEGSTQLNAGLGAFGEGIEQAYNGSLLLQEGAGLLDEAGGELYEGFGTLTDGMRSMKDGVKTFDEEGVQELDDLGGEELENLTLRLRALKAADQGYDNFAGLREGKTGSVRFLLETGEIKK